METPTFSILDLAGNNFLIAFTINGLKAVLSTSGDGHSNGICTITGVIHILRWGTEDVTMELDLDDFVS